MYSLLNNYRIIYLKIEDNWEDIFHTQWATFSTPRSVIVENKIVIINSKGHLMFDVD